MHKKNQQEWWVYGVFRPYINGIIALLKILFVRDPSSNAKLESFDVKLSKNNAFSEKNSCFNVKSSKSNAFSEKNSCFLLKKVEKESFLTSLKTILLLFFIKPSSIKTKRPDNNENKVGPLFLSN